MTNNYKMGLLFQLAFFASALVCFSNSSLLKGSDELLLNASSSPADSKSTGTKMNIDPAGSPPRAAASGSSEPRMLEAMPSSAALSHHHPFDDEEEKDGEDHFSGSNVTVAHGKTASLNCRIRGSINNNTQVSWIRYRDLQLLTVGETTYTADQRFTAAVNHGNPQTKTEFPTTIWSLHIQGVQFRDQGGYECQIGSTPRLSRYIHLTVVEPSTTILGGSEMHIDVGSTINLTCVVQHTPEPPDHVFWTHNQQMVNYDSKRGGISVMIQRGPTTISSLLIQKAARKDSGVYICSPSSAPASSVSIHILEGERPAAMYSTSARGSMPPEAVCYFYLILFGICWQRR